MFSEHSSPHLLLETQNVSLLGRVEEWNCWSSGRCRVGVGSASVGTETLETTFVGAHRIHRAPWFPAAALSRPLASPAPGAVSLQGPPPCPAAPMKPTRAAEEKGPVAGVFLGLCEHAWFLCPGSETVFLSQARNT